mmetsp:Transcript_18168/g.31895  ORF Transcript_18168/g.31895 Transcript_18168/m.31895 type:complete len:514 (-) Transcript_18168:20-1561(-)
MALLGFALIFVAVSARREQVSMKSNMGLGNGDLQGLSALQTSLEAMPELCQNKIMRETCKALDRDNNPKTSSVFELSEALSASASSVEAFLKSIALPMNGQRRFPCQQLCQKVVRSIDSVRLPPTSDVGCRMGKATVRRNAVCDVDVSPEALEKIKFSSEGINFHKGHPLQKNQGQIRGRLDLAIQGHKVEHKTKTDISVEDAKVLVANLFRVYPMLAMDVRSLSEEALEALSEEALEEPFEKRPIVKSKQDTACLAHCREDVDCIIKRLTCSKCSICRAGVKSRTTTTTTATTQGWLQNVWHAVKPHVQELQDRLNTTVRDIQDRFHQDPPEVTWHHRFADQLEKVNVKAQAQMAAAIRDSLKDKEQLKIWFGDTSGETRQRIRFVLNSIDKVLINVAYKPGGETCSDTTYAFVYPYGGKSKNEKGQFVYYMCDYYFKVPLGEQIETLTHEGSHHAVGFTDDVRFETEYYEGEVTAYGRDLCRILARDHPKDALKNADNYCYYINDLVTRRR